ncbi:MAG: hypothetical protein HZA00_08440 [Nitrospinae bacterium]|nr:hypothetical protein [Nitrospinota bacterium]
MEVQFNSLSDEELVELIRENKPLAFHELMRRYKDAIYSIAGAFFTGKQNIGWASKVEAIKEGETGLSMVVLNYNPEKEVFFENYAKVTIRGYILNYINKNKSMVISPTIQKKVNMVIKVASELKSSIDYNEDESLVDFIQNNKDSIIEILHKKDSEVIWDGFWDECLLILNIYESSLDQTKEDENGKEITLHEVIPSKNPSPLEDIEHKEAHGIFKDIYKRGMYKIINQYSQDTRSAIQKKILERYYIYGEEEESLITSLNDLGYKGDTLLRQYKSRFKQEICENHMTLIYSIITDLNNYFDFTYIGSEDPFCEDFMYLCDAIRNLELLKEVES